MIRLGRSGLGMIDQGAQIGEDAQRVAQAVEHVTGLSDPLDGVTIG